MAPGADSPDHQRAGEAPAHPGSGGQHAGRRDPRAEPRRRLGDRHQARTLPTRTALVARGSDLAVPALTARGARAVFAAGRLHRLPPFNSTISNVPGPNVPGYMCGARLVAHYPVSVVTDGQGLNITLVGYLGQLHFGLVSSRELVPDIDELAGYLAEELALLAEAAEKRAAEQSGP